MKRGSRTLAALSVACVIGAGAGTALAHDDRGHHRDGSDTLADLTPGRAFDPVAASSPCVGAPGGRAADPFVVPAGYDQAIVAEESDPLANAAGTSEDLWDMNTQNESGKDAGRYVYRAHEVGPAGGDPRTTAGGAGVTVTDLKTGKTRLIAERSDWERFDGIVWTPWGTILAAEEVIAQAAPDPDVPQARGGLVYEFFLDRHDPTRLDPSRERITSGDGTTDTVRDGIRARPALGAKSHEGMRFDKFGFHYGISETRGQTTANQAGAIFRFVPDRWGDLAKGRLQALQTPDRRYGAGTWVTLDAAAAQVDADAEAERKGANEYQRPEDVETGVSTGRDVNNHGRTVYVAVTEGTEGGVIAVDVRRPQRPVAYQYASHSGDYLNSDNLALDSRGNLVITEDPPTNPVGADIWVAAPPRGGTRPASRLERFATLKDCAAEPTGIYFAMAGTQRYTRWNPNRDVRELVHGRTLLVNRQHSGEGTTADQLVAIAAEDDQQHGHGHHGHR